ncbi:MAG: SDR family oxidoreductase [Actinobacteria bacterium]|nr:SDR family oxidoreductase [Actinomycetota bacterium]MCG2818181.1 SDR family oxidoreductase [Actinomycetes bacterium]MBU4218423.1 SDR family oxidoreductase [Actinomycetota bacterium]MBU4358486.1 SDR family oxidoreductase [Actinomycetota bacterium]MBU4393103.1 SDR family oxidoreductase [Actinomycetota bacterium]
MKERSVAGKWALVTGAGSGMGRTTTLELAREGANLILVDISGESMGKVAREVEALGVEAHTFCVDLTEWGQVENMADAIHARWGAVDILINCAGIAHMSHMVETTLEDWAKLLAVNLWSIIHMVNAFAPKMIERGSGQVVNISSGQAFFAVPTWGAYACTKYAVDGYSEALRYELFWHGIGVTTVFPGIVRTPFYEAITGGPLVRIGMKVLMAVAAKPETLSRMIVKGIKRNKRHVIQPIMLPIYFLKRTMPWVFEGAGKVVAWVLKREEAGIAP